MFKVYTTEWFIFALPLVGVLYFAALKADLGLLNQLYLFLVYEDGPLEVLSFGFFFASSLGGIAIVRRAFHAGFQMVGWFHLGLSAFLMFVALEEISYGQRIFQFATPGELERANRQKEFNFHNIRAVERFTLVIGPLLISLYGIFGWAARLMMKWVLPQRFVTDTRLPLIATPWYVASYFLPLAVFTLIALFAKNEVSFWVDRDQEVAEFFLSLGFLLFIFTAWHDLNRLRYQPEAEAAVLLRHREQSEAHTGVGVEGIGGCSTAEKKLGVGPSGSRFRKDGGGGSRRKPGDRVE
jgi:hypothetical protein